MAPHRTQCLCSRLGWKNCPPPRRAGLVGWRGTLLLVFSWPREEADGRAGISLTPQTAVSGVRAHCTPQSGSCGPRQRPWRAPNDPEKGPGARVQALPAWLEPGACPALPFRATSVRFSLSEAQSLTTQRSPGHGMVSDIQQAGREQREEGTGGERSVQRA